MTGGVGAAIVIAGRRAPQPQASPGASGRRGAVHLVAALQRAGYCGAQSDLQIVRARTGDVMFASLRGPMLAAILVRPLLNRLDVGDAVELNEGRPSDQVVAALSVMINRTRDVPAGVAAFFSVSDALAGAPRDQVAAQLRTDRAGQVAGVWYQGRSAAGLHTLALGFDEASLASALASRGR